MAANRTLLLTGFAPFAGDSENPAALIAQALDGRVLGSWQVRSGILPVSFAAAPRQLRQLLRQHQPEAVVALGLAAGRARIGLERVALNLIDARIPDEDGAQPIDQPVRRGSPAARFSTAPLKVLLAAAQHAGWPVELSLSAGSFVCNALYYELLQQLRRRPQCPGLFIHVPALPQQAERHGAALPLQLQIEVIGGLLAQLDASLPPGAVPSGGSEC